MVGFPLADEEQIKELTFSQVFLGGAEGEVKTRLQFVSGSL